VEILIPLTGFDHEVNDASMLPELPVQGNHSEKTTAGEKCCSPNNSLKEPKVNNKSDNDFVHTMAFGKTYAFSH
jgi:hypothetical protein